MYDEKTGAWTGSEITLAPFYSPYVRLLTPSLVPFLPITEELFVKFCERLIQTEPMRRKGVKLDTVPVAGCQHLPHGSRNYWECALRHLTNPENHQVGTCAMGRSEMDSVLDSRLRVHGLKGLRVIDASAIPMVPSGNINGPIIMLAERGADFIKQEHDAFLAQPAFKRSNIMFVPCFVPPSSGCPRLPPGSPASLAAPGYISKTPIIV
uniref:Glucose-methanol-choline oxidoreductase C-terminal domain-containing protein n=1 Tax=Timema poppense TaxID=170557 RepID=A0A7R9CUE1_TIMPO|nr:unnamed protein product [Timema poppensis]